MADRGSVAHAEHAQIQHPSHFGRYAMVLAALLVLTALTYLAARAHLPGGWAITVALAIACAKGALVVLFFMHLWDQEGANRLVFLTSLVFVALLVGFTVMDNATRFRLSNPPGSTGALPAPGYAPPAEGGDRLVR
jgi:cytochrome c oxidase subunit IV